MADDHPQRPGRHAGPRRDLLPNVHHAHQRQRIDHDAGRDGVLVPFAGGRNVSDRDPGAEPGSGAASASASSTTSSRRSRTRAGSAPRTPTAALRNAARHVRRSRHQGRGRRRGADLQRRRREAGRSGSRTRADASARPEAVPRRSAAAGTAFSATTEARARTWGSSTRDASDRARPTCESPTTTVRTATSSSSSF